MDKKDKILKAYYMINTINVIAKDLERVKKLNIVDGYSFSDLEQNIQSLDRKDFSEIKGIIEDFLTRKLKAKNYRLESELNKVYIQGIDD